MRLLAELLLFPITGPVRGLQFIVQQIQAEMETELMNEDRVRGEMAELSLRYSRGDISEAEFQAREDELLEELEAIRAYQDGLTEEYLTLQAQEPEDE